MFRFHWFLPIAALACMTFFFLSACTIYVVTEEGVRRKLMFGPAISSSQSHKYTPWNYEILQVRGVFPFYYLYAFAYQDIFELSPNNLPFRASILFFFCRNFLDLIIFIDENIMCDKVNPKSRARFRELADKYRRLKKNHQIIYWVLNNI